jgi:hypothetical protein
VLEPTVTPPNVHTLHLGDLQQKQPVSVLLELLAPPVLNLGDMSTRRVRLAQVYARSDTGPHTAPLDMVATYTPAPSPAPDAVLDAAARSNAARLHRRALDAAAGGDRATAVTLMRSAAARLTELGESALAAMAHQEASTLEQTGHTTRLGAKELTYATRRLGKR